MKNSISTIQNNTTKFSGTDLQKVFFCLTTIIWLTTLALPVQSQNIVEAEYFFNEDPGFGEGVTINVTSPSPNVNDLSFIADVSNLDVGFNRLFVRAKDDNNRWTQTQQSTFYKEHLSWDLPNIVEAEYFFNEDPGYGKGVTINFASPSPNVNDLSFIADVSNLDVGFNRLFVRAKDDNNRWTQTQQSTFYKEHLSWDLPNIVEAEYFFNEDPGYGKGVTINFASPSPNVNDLSFIADVSNLDVGFNRLFVRAKDDNDRWTQTQESTFFKEQLSWDLPNIVEAEYFFNEDPGLGNGIKIPIANPQPMIENVNFIADASSLAMGRHRIYVRAKDANGQWSLIKGNDFCKTPYINFTTNIANIGQPTIFTNLSESTDENISFFWDVNDDGETDYTDTDDFTHVYDAPGTYLAKLLIELEGGCRDSIVKEVVVLNAIPEITEIPIASLITYGQTLGESLLEGGEANYYEEPVSGNFVFVHSDTIPQSAATFLAEVLFVPDDVETFSEVNLQIEVDVVPKEITITGSFTAHNKTYDGTINATIDENLLELSGLIHQDIVNLTGLVLEFAQAEPGNDILVSIVDASLAGEHESNYTLSLQDAPTSNADIYTPNFTLELFAVPDNIGASLSGAGDYQAGEEVVISASEVQGYVFTGWTGSEEDMELINDPDVLSHAFTMPNRNISFTAQYSLLPDQFIMQITDFQGIAGEEIPLDVVITNSAPFTGFNLDIPLPEGFSFVEESAQLFRDDDHFLSATIIQGNVLRMISASPSNAAFSGSDGIIVSMNLQTPQGEGGTFSLSLHNALIGNESEVNVLTGTIDGTITLEPSEPPPIFEYYMILNDAEGLAGEQITINLEITNETSFTGFNLDIPLPAGFSFVEGSAQLFRDDDHFLSATIIQGNILRMISASPSNAAFSGNDGIIVSMNLQTPQGDGGTFSLPLHNALIGNESEENVLTGTIDGTITLEPSEPPPVFEYYMILNDAEGVAGEQITINLEITNEASFTGFNLDIPLPEGFSFVEGSEELYRHNDHTLSVAVTEGNTVRIISASASNTPFMGENGNILSLYLSTPQVVGTYTLEISNAVIGNVHGENVITGTQNGHVTLLQGQEPELFMLTLEHYPSEINPELIGGGFYEEGERILITAGEQEGYDFISWDGDEMDISNLEDPLVMSTYFTMPEREVILTATYQENVSIQSMKDKNPQLFPNPFNDNVIIMNAGMISFVRITDVLGSFIEEKRFDNEPKKVSLNLGYLHNGVYMIYIQDASGRVWVEKIVKQ